VFCCTFLYDIVEIFLD